MTDARYKMTAVLVRNPATGQLIETTEKVFYSIYQDKGFELVDRKAAAKEPVTKTGNGVKRNGERATAFTGSAASIAAGLGLDDKATPNKTSVAMDNTETVDDEDANA